MRVSRIVELQESNKNRYFVVNEEDDLYRFSLKILRERSETGLFYPSLEAARSEFSETMDEVDANKQRFILGDPSLDQSEDGQKKRKTIFDGFRTQTEKKYLSRVEFSERLEELLSFPDEAALKMQWVFEDGSTLNLAYMLLSLRRDYPNEGFNIFDAEDF